MKNVTNQEIKRYLDAVLATGETASSWAGRAKSAASNIARLRKDPDGTSLMKSETLRSLIENAPATAPAAPKNLLAYANLLDLDDTPLNIRKGASTFDVPRYDLSLAAGAGSLNDDDAGPLDYLNFSTTWLRQITESDPEKLAVVRVLGDNMSPTLENGDWVFVELNRDAIVSGDIHILLVGGRLQVRRIFGDGSAGKTVVSADNRAIEPTVEQPVEVQVLGRVCGIAGRGL